MGFGRGTGFTARLTTFLVSGVITLIGWKWRQWLVSGKLLSSRTAVPGGVYTPKPTAGKLTATRTTVVT